MHISGVIAEYLMALEVYEVDYTKRLGAWTIEWSIYPEIVEKEYSKMTAQRWKNG